MRRTLIAVALAGMAVALAATAAMVGATSVSTAPEPAYVSRTSPTTAGHARIRPVVVTTTTADDHGGERSRAS